MPFRAPRWKYARHTIIVAGILLNLGIWLLWADPVATWRALAGAFRAPHEDLSLVGQACPDLKVAVCPSCSAVPTDAPAAGDEVVGLSSFRGKQVLCLFLSSFT